MRIIQADPSFFTLPYDLQLCEALASQGHSVSLIGRPLREGERIAAGSKADMLPLYYHHAEHIRRTKGAGRLFSLVKGIEHLGNSTTFLKEVKRQRPDVVHFQWVPLPLSDFYLVKAVREVAPVVMTVHDTVPFRGHPTSTLQFSRWKETLQEFDALVVHTAFSKENLCSSGFAAEKIHVIPHGVFDFGIAPPRSSHRDGTVRILCFGEIKPYKGIDVLLRAFAELPPSIRKKAKLCIVGRPRMDVSPLLRLAEDLGIASHVEWTLRFIPEEEVPAVLSEADLFAFPYKEIDASGALMMAIPCGKPVVVSALEPFLEVVGTSSAACTFPPGDYHALAKLFHSLLYDEEMYSRAASLSRELSGNRFSWSEIACRTVEMYKILVDSGAKRRHG